MDLLTLDEREQKTFCGKPPECTRHMRMCRNKPLFPRHHILQGKQLEEQLREAREGSVRERQKSEQAVQRAESRVNDLERAWELLAAKVVPLADRNADLEWVSHKTPTQSANPQYFLDRLNTTATPSDSLGGAPSGPQRRLGGGEPKHANIPCKNRFSLVALTNATVSPPMLMGVNLGSL